MNELRLDNAHDIYRDGASIARLKKDTAEVHRLRAQQAGLCLLRCEEGESFVDYTHGVPWFNRILGLPVQHLDVATKIIREKLSELPTVKKVLQLTLDVKEGKRNLTGSFKVQANDGSVATGEF
ncbi:hypothetical protein [Fibrobacter sp. UWH4]|uniref:hypothetical protein n=1 Tax=Fibrobacter sp. UWH4 TaxID=1896210 RepID=UPI0009154304|nr:hypothetical protein [Fibrobacter sp. UWH4]SHL04478.1 hypothetical protein SAMN05720762_10449 [Fibrobacter sp. UWH4]